MLGTEKMMNKNGIKTNLCPGTKLSFEHLIKGCNFCDLKHPKFTKSHFVFFIQNSECYVFIITE